MQKLEAWLKKYKFYLRVFVYSLLVFTATEVFTFSRSKDPALMVYFNKNLNIINHYCEKDQYRNPFMTSVTFGKMKMTGAIAHCEPKANGFKLVFEKRYWDGLTDLNKTQLMMHEMAHCMFDENHYDDPTHFMYSFMNTIDGLSLAIQVHNYFTLKCGNKSG